jgi:tRNA threonylcarbamoyl adenosine modification protein (Sua5/YciO/YrdC/YwlC family)
MVAYPTETVWGIGADATSDAAIDRLRGWKGRGDDAPFSVLVAGMGGLAALGCELGAVAQNLADTFWPGPLTLVVPCGPSFARGVRRADGAVGLRCSADPVAGALARRCEAEGVGPITSTSLNRSGSPPATTAAEAREVVGDEPDGPHVIEWQGAEAGGAAPSTVVDLTESEPRVLRWGALPPEAVEPLLRRVSPA